MVKPAAFILALLMPALLTTALPARAADPPSPQANAAWLAANAKDPGVRLLPSGLQYRVLKSGFGAKPRAEDVAEVYYSASLINGVVVDGTSPGLPASLPVNGVIPGLSEALQLMRAGDRWQLAIPASLNFSDKTTNAAVPVNQTLIFDLTLLRVMPPSPLPQGESPSPFSIYGGGREEGARITIHP